MMIMSEIPPQKSHKRMPLHPFIRRNLMAFGIRWTIGFMLVAWFTSQYPTMSWLWMAATLGAFFSFFLLFLIHIIMMSEKGPLVKIRAFLEKIITQ